MGGGATKRLLEDKMLYPAKKFVITSLEEDGERPPAIVR